MPETIELNDQELTEALDASDPVKRTDEISRLHGEISSRSAPKRVLDRITGRESDLQREYRSRFNADSHGRLAEDEARYHFDPFLRKLANAVGTLDREHYPVGKEAFATQERQKDVVLRLADLAHENGYITTGSNYPNYPINSTNPLKGEEDIRERGGYLMHAVDERLIFYTQRVQGEGKGTEVLKRLSNLSRQQEKIVDSMAEVLEKGESHLPIGTNLEAETTHEEAKASMLGAIEVIRSLTNMRGWLEQRSKHGDPIRLDMDPLSPRVIANSVIKERLGDDSQAGHMYKVSLGLDISVEVHLQLNGEFSLRLISDLTEEQREEAVEHFDYLKGMTDVNRKYKLETPSVWTKEEKDKALKAITDEKPLY